ncbi:MAG: hypothetical protein OMM_11899 [Candidatus Magnetoglobus multicellularis str. Araruama]|uniref:Uncharacterized protein n=1 Tax=Candidatus Magnetoglobus multicellularis str. Araruama TaxID=890399 RepID=A0A1V1NX17_9BACT|nr:MAG: hypothetical protein OMM_11899 [Candidatus Magnetoglobus multicellularis str. Araruama]
MSENTIQNPDDKSIIDRNNEILINILRVLTMLENSLNRLMRNNFYDPAQYPEEFFVIESFILQMRCWITDYKFLSGTKNFSCLSMILLSNLCGMIIDLIDIVTSLKGKNRLQKIKKLLIKS